MARTSLRALRKLFTATIEVGDVTGCAPTSGGYGRPHGLTSLLGRRQSCHSFRALDGNRDDRVDPDAVASPFDGERMPVWPGVDDDRTGRAQQRVGSPQHVVGPEQVDVDDRTEGVGRHIQRRSREVPSRTGDEHTMSPNAARACPSASLSMSSRFWRARWSMVSGAESTSRIHVHPQAFDLVAAHSCEAVDAGVRDPPCSCTAANLWWPFWRERSRPSGEGTRSTYFITARRHLRPVAVPRSPRRTSSP